MKAILSATKDFGPMAILRISSSSATDPAYDDIAGRMAAGLTAVIRICSGIVLADQFARSKGLNLASGAPDDAHHP